MAYSVRTMRESKGQAGSAVQRLGIRVPIIQGPFGGGLSTAKLSAVVSNAGGLGSYGAHVLDPAEIVKVADDIRALTDRPFALNLWVSDHDPGGLSVSAEEFAVMVRLFRPYFRELGLDDPEPPERFHHAFETQVEALMEARPPVFSFVFGIPSPDVLERCRRLGIVTVGAATSVAEARALDEARVDVIVATGFEAGGHRPSFLARAEDSLLGTFALIPLVADRVNAPVIAAGGIVDHRGVSAALTLGASAVQVGTAFLACEESGATDEHRALLFSERAHDTVLTRAFTGRLARGIRNRWTDEMAGRLAELPPFPIQSFFVSKLKDAAVRAQRTDLVSLWAGQAAPNLRHRKAAHLMSSLTQEIHP